MARPDIDVAAYLARIGYSGPVDATLQTLTGLVAGRNLAIHSPTATEHIRFDTVAAVLDALTTRFGIDLSGLGGVETRVAQMLGD